MKITTEDSSTVLPDFLMVGAAKSGTTTLYHYLDKHPDVYFPKNVKEPHYFSFGNQSPQYSDSKFVEKLIWKTDDYVKLYKNAPTGAKIGDGSTSYLYNWHKAIENIKHLYGPSYRKLKILIILRNPIDRAYSHYNFLLRNGLEHLPFETALRPEVIAVRKDERWGFDYLEYGIYSQAIEQYKLHFDNVKVFLFEDLAHPEMVSIELCNFLEIDPRIVLEFPRSNPSGRPKNSWLVHQLLRNASLKRAANLLPNSLKRNVLKKRDKVLQKVLEKPPLPQQIHDALCRYYEPSIRQLESLLGKNLTSWRNP